MSLSPLYAAPIKDLHVTTTAGLHQPFGWLRRGHAKITTFRVCAGPLGTSWTVAAALRVRCAPPCAGATRGPAQLLDPCFETGERAAATRGGLGRPVRRVAVSRLLSAPRGCFSPFAHATRCAIGLGPVFSLGWGTPPVRAILSNSATASPVGPGTGMSPRAPCRSRHGPVSHATHNCHSGPAAPCSLAATGGIPVGFCSWAY